MLCSRINKRIASHFGVECPLEEQPDIRMCEACLKKQLVDCRELKKEFYYQWRKLKDKIIKQNKRSKNAKKKGSTQKEKHSGFQIKTGTQG